MEQIPSQIIGPVGNILTDTKHLEHVTSSTKRVADMISKMEVLKGKSKDVNEHKEKNKRNDKEIPASVEGWLRDVENVKDEVQSISSDVNIGCLNIKKRYRAGRNAFKTIEKIERLINLEEEIIWSDAIIPLGRVDSEPSASTLAPSPSCEITQTGFKSRDKAFKDALKYLQQDDKSSQVIALCGMGGVGKTNMMEQLGKVARENKMFNWIVKVVIGRNPDILYVQHCIALYMGDCDLPNASTSERADYLCKIFEKLSQDNQKVLIILDDVWEPIELIDIGLTRPLPNGVKLLLTSRYSTICKRIAHDANSDLQVVKIEVLEVAEAHKFFSGITGVLEEHDPEMYHIGCEIVKYCAGLPLAIKLIASTLKSEDMFVWKHTLNRMKNNDLDENLQEIIKINYEDSKSDLDIEDSKSDIDIEDEDKEIFLHCSLFPEDSNISIEDLTRHAWGLKLLKNVSTLREARDRTKTCVQNLINANLLINSDHVGSVKLDDHGRVFKGDPAWIINHGDVYKWGIDETGESCKKMSLTCRGLYEFPGEFKYPNVDLLLLMNGDESLKFSEDFFENMANLEVIAYYNMSYPLLPRSLKFSTNLKALCLQSCKLMFNECSFIGDLVNLEMLSFSHCGIRKLPSTIGNLKKLKLLDLTGCIDVCIDDGVFKKLVNLEELYVSAIRFTDSNWEELIMLSTQLFALEVEFFEKKTQLEKFSFKKLYKFRIAMGCELENIEGNALKLVTDCNNIMSSKINELLKKTEKLHLNVQGMFHLGDVLVKPYGQHSFSNLRELEVCDCADLIRLFPISVARGLGKLERLNISSCDRLEALVYKDSGGEIIKFEELRFLSLKKLPNLESLFLNNVVELPQLVEFEVEGLPNFTSIYTGGKNISAREWPFLNNQVRISKLKKLKIGHMDKLKQIWACSSEEKVNNISMLREIVVEGCDSLVNLFPTNLMRVCNHLERLEVTNCGSIKQILNEDLGFGGEIDLVSSNLRSIRVEGCDSLVTLFPTNPMRVLKHLERLEVYRCGSIEVIFNIDLECVGREVGTSSLRNIHVKDSRNLREVWRITGRENCSSYPIFLFVEKINIHHCERFRNVFTPVNTKFYMRAVDLTINNCRGPMSDEEEVISWSKKEEDDSISTVAFPSSVMHAFYHLQNLQLMDHKGVEVVFEMKSSPAGGRESVTTTNNQQSLLPHLQVVELTEMKSMSHVWKCSNWNNFLSLQNQSSFKNLTTIEMWYCNRIKYLFSPLMVNFLSNLKVVNISACDEMEAVVSNRDDTDEEMTLLDTSTSFFPHLHSLSLGWLRNLKCIDDAKDTTSIIDDQSKFPQIDSVSWSLCQYSREIFIQSCDGLSSVIPSYAVGKMQKLQVLQVESCKSLVEVFAEGNCGTNSTAITRAIPIPELSNLTKLNITDCHLLQHVFTFSTLESLRKLEELAIRECKAMKMIVKEENGEQTSTSKVVVFRNLKSLELFRLPNLETFFSGKNDFHWPSMEKVVISECPKMMVFTSGQLTTPKLKYIHTDFGKHSLECDETSSETRSLERLPVLSCHNLIELHMESNHGVKCIFPSNGLLQLQKLETIRVIHCYEVEKVFEVKEAMEGTDSVVQIPNLTQMQLEWLYSLKYIWKNNHHVLEFPNLTTLSISYCDELQHVFTSSMVGGVMQLQHLKITNCDALEVIVKEEKSESEYDDRVKEIVKFPCLKSLKLISLENLKGFCLGKDDFSLPLLDTLQITECPKVTVFTNGHVVATPALNVIDANFERCYIKEDINSFITNMRKEVFQF